MKIPRNVLYALIGLGLALATSTEAADQPCAAGCGTQDVTCLKTARVMAASCRTDCRTSSAPADLGGCIGRCADSARAARATCSSDAASCVGNCGPAAPSSASSDASSCLGSCGADLGTCARNVAAGIKTCVTGCRGATDRAGCLADCASAAQSAAATCASDFQSCAGGCGSTTTTTPGPSTTTSTMPEPPGCGDPTDRACGGRCPNPGDVCQNVSGSCTCMAR